MTAIAKPFGPTATPIGRNMGNLSGGVCAALVALPSILSCGIVIYAPLGPGFVARGVTAAFVTAIVAACVAAVLDGPLMHINVPRASLAALLSLLVLQLSANPAFAAAAAQGPGGVALALVGAVLAAQLVAGVLQSGLGALHLGRLVRFVPRPVLAGLVNGFALQIILTQLPALFGAASLAEVRAAMAAGSWRPWPLLFGCVAGLASLLASLLARGRARFVPAPLIGLAIATALAVGVAHAAPDAAHAATWIGRLIGPIELDPSTFSGLIDAVAVANRGVLAASALPIAQTGITLAVISSLQSLINLAAGDTFTGRRHDPARALMAQGTGNVLAALLGGTPGGGSSSTTRVAHAAGARGRMVNVAFAACIIVVLLLCRDTIARIPLSVMAAIVIVATLDTMDAWSGRLLARVVRWRGDDDAPEPDEPGADVAGANTAVSLAPEGGTGRQLIDLATMALVVVLLLTAGSLVALAIGLALASFSFFARSRHFFVRAVTRGDVERSRTSRDAVCAAALAREGGRIVLVSLQGPLFFGTAEYLLDRIDTDFRGAETVILDFTRVADIDITGIVALQRLRGMLGQAGTIVLFAGLALTPRRRAMFAEAGWRAADGGQFESRDEALCAAEDRLLQRLGLDARGAIEIGFADMALLAPLSPEDAALLAAHTVRREYPAGATIVRAGEPGDAAFFLCAGEICVVSAGSGRRTVLGRFRPGTIFGEMALLTGNPRSASVEALTPVVVRALTTEALLALETVAPRMATALMRGIGRQLSARVSDLTRAIDALGT